MRSLKLAFALTLALTGCSAAPAEESDTATGAATATKSTDDSEVCSMWNSNCLAYCDDEATKDKCVSDCAATNAKCHVLAPYVAKEGKRCTKNHSDCNGDSVCNNSVSVCYIDTCKDGVSNCRAEHDEDTCTAAFDWVCNGVTQ